MFNRNFYLSMKYKSSTSKQVQRKEQNTAFKANSSLTIEINIDTDIQDLKLAINDCLDYPSKETAWSNLDDLLTQQGLSKYLTTEQSISIIDTFYNHFQIQPLCSDSVLCAIKVCLKKCNEYIPPEIINFLFEYSLSRIKHYSKISIINESFCIIILILPYTTEDQRQFFVDYIYSEYPKFCFIDSFPHSSFFISICTFFEVCSYEEAFPSFQKLSNIVYSFLPCKQWGLPFDVIRIIRTAIEKDPNICSLLLEPRNKFIKLLAELVSRNQNALSTKAINLCTQIIKLCEIIPIQVISLNESDTLQNTNETEKNNIVSINNPNENSFLDMNDIQDFVKTALKCLPTQEKKLEIKIIRCIAESLQIGLDPSLIYNQTLVNIFNLIESPNLMNYEQKKAIIYFSSIALQIAPEQFLQPFIESNDGGIVEIAFESTDNSDEDMLFDTLNIILILLQYRQSFIGGKRYDDSVNYYLSILDPDIDLSNIQLIENDEIQNLAYLIDQLIQIDEN